MATERILVNAKVADKFREVLSATIDQVFPDKNGLVLIDKRPVETNARLLEDAVSKGAKALYGDISDKRELATAMRPVVLTGVKEDMDLYYTESFGPTVSLFVVEDDEEAIKIANDTEVKSPISTWKCPMLHADSTLVRLGFGGIYRESAAWLPDREAD